MVKRKLSWFNKVILTFMTAITLLLAGIYLSLQCKVCFFGSDSSKVCPFSKGKADAKKR